MRNALRTIYLATKEVFSNKKYVTLFLVIFLCILIVLISIPIFTIPGNSLALQIKIFSFYNYLLLIFLSSLISLMISMNIYNYKLKRSMMNASGGLIGGVVGFFGGIVGTASCPLCLAALLGFLGFGSILFLLKYKIYVSLIPIVFIFISLYFVSSSIERKCERCKLKGGR